MMTRSPLVILCSSLALLCVISRAYTADVDILLEIAQIRLDPYLQDWNRSNVSRYCEWSYIQCNSTTGRVTDINLGSEKTSESKLQGRWPDSVLQLTELTFLDLRNNRIHGSIAPEFWLLPELSRVELSSTGLVVRFPQQRLPDQLIHLNVAQTFYNGTIPEMNWDLVKVMDFTALSLSCPLPQSFVNFMRNTSGTLRKGQMYCLMSSTPLPVDTEDRICGQLPLRESLCRTYPLVKPPVPAREISQWSFDFDGLRLNFTKDALSVFHTYKNRNGDSIPFVDEYMSVHFWGIGQEIRQQVGNWFQLTVFDGITDIRASAPNLLLATSTASGPGGRLNITVSFLIISSKKIKFSMLIPSASSPEICCLRPPNLTVIITTEGGFQFVENDYNIPVQLPISVAMRAPHSRQGGAAPLCYINAAGNRCQSPAGVLTVDLNLLGTEAIIRHETARTLLEISFSLNGSVDGVPMSPLNTGVTDGQILSGLGSNTAIRQLTFTNSSNIFTITATEDQQFVSLGYSIHTKPWNQSLLYDPDLSLALLFDPSAEPPAAALTTPAAVQALVEQSNTIGIAVGVSISVVVVAAVSIALIYYYRAKAAQKLNQKKLRSALKSHENPAPVAKVQDQQRSTAETKAESGRWHRASTPPNPN